ncbi:unnamed protein product [Rotaria sordida]|uniref:Reverse transcriptase domain-containing protein n=1 Tax=Rotaria sordida TaxID=392033 RepID=A0A819YL25_9BILA|nr:unnamed protein product [Rotaria sordida]
MEYWDEISKEIENSIKQHDSSTAFATIRRLKGNRTNVENLPIQDKEGNILNNSRDRMVRWKEHFSELLNVHSNIDQSILQNITPSTIPVMEQIRQDKLPSLNEVKEAINKMKSGKAPGIDSISVDLLKVGGEPIAIWLHEIIVEIWETEEMVEDWTTAILIRIYKNKGDKKMCDNYRGISLLVAASKVFSRIILNRVQHLIDNQLLEQQAGFRKNRSTIDQIFILKMIMERSQEYNKPLHMCFIDIQKAYDSANRDLLWQICRYYGTGDKLIRMFKLLYKNTKAKVRINSEMSDEFSIETGVMQGGIPSPILYIH